MSKERFVTPPEALYIVLAADGSRMTFESLAHASLSASRLVQAGTDCRLLSYQWAAELSFPGAM